MSKLDQVKALRLAREARRQTAAAIDATVSRTRAGLRDSEAGREALKRAEAKAAGLAPSRKTPGGLGAPRTGAEVRRGAAKKRRPASPVQRDRQPADRVTEGAASPSPGGRPGRPKGPPSAKLLLTIPEVLGAAIDKECRARKLASRQETIRVLLEEALK